MKGKLTLVPTPLIDRGPMDCRAQEILMKAVSDSPQKVLILVEEAKQGRRRWIDWGLPRQWVDQFVLFNEHTQEQLLSELISKLLSGLDLYLMSDGGMPAFCDPGQELVKACHQHGIRVTSTPFDHSVILSLALSGLPHKRFLFDGELPREQTQRKERLRQLWMIHETVVLLDAPYRLGKLLSDLAFLSQSQGPRQVAVVRNLGYPDEEVLVGFLDQIQTKIDLNEKKEFIVVIDGK